MTVLGRAPHDARIWARPGRERSAARTRDGRETNAGGGTATALDEAPEVAAPGGSGHLDVLSGVREIGEVRERTSRNPGRGDRGSGIVLGLGFVAAAAAFAGVGPGPTTAQAITLLLLVVLYALAHQTELMLTAGAAVPTQPVLVGMLLTCPPSLTPVAVLAGLQLADASQAFVPGLTATQRLGGLIVRSAAGWSCIAPAAVLWTAGAPPPALDHAVVYLLAFGAQISLDAVVALARAVSLRVSPRRVLPALAWTFTIDSLLAPLGLCVVLAAGGSVAPLAVLAAPIGLVRLLARDRTRQLRTAVTISAAFDAVHEEARADALTGLANRRAWEEAVSTARGSPEAPVGVLMADVDNLKRVNDSLGHEAGDELLRTVGGVLAALAPPGSLVARLGGDEFGILVPPTRDAHSEDRTGEQLILALRGAMAAHPGVGGYPLSSSLGWSSSPPQPDATEAAREADVLAGEDKAHRKSGRDHGSGSRRPDQRGQIGNVPY